MNGCRRGFTTRRNIQYILRLIGSGGRRLLCSDAGRDCGGEKDRTAINAGSDCRFSASTHGVPYVCISELVSTQFEVIEYGGTFLFDRVKEVLYPGDRGRETDSLQGHEMDTDGTAGLNSAAAYYYQCRGDIMRTTCAATHEIFDSM